MASMAAPHGGNRIAAAAAQGVHPRRLLDASASLAPLRWGVRWQAQLAAGLGPAVLRDYPDRSHGELRGVLARLHGLDPQMVLPGNGAAELFTWAARDAAAAGCSALSAPGFGDYRRALDCWGGATCSWPLPLQWDDRCPAALPQPPAAEVLWITNPHNPSGRLWSRAALEPLLAAHRLVIVDEAFLPLVPGGEAQSLIPLLVAHPNLVVIRSLTKLYGLAGLRLGYALGEPERLQRWSSWRDPWPINGLATALALRLLSVPQQYRRHCAWVQAWCQRERDWLTPRLAALQGPSGRLQPLPSAANYLLLRGEVSLVPLRERVEARHGVLLRDCRSFEGLDAHWLRIGLQDRRGNRRLLQALRREWAQD